MIPAHGQRCSVGLVNSGLNWTKFVGWIIFSLKMKLIVFRAPVDLHIKISLSLMLTLALP